MYRAFYDIVDGVRQWRIWSLLAVQDIRSRYRRSFLGQFWITVSMGVTIAAIAFVYAAIFKIPLEIYVPWVASSFVCWGFMAAIVNESTMTFIEAEGYIKTVALPKSTYVYRMLLRVLIVFAHNLVLMPIVFVIFRMPPKPALATLIPAVVLVLINGGWVAIALGALAARFRDLPIMVSNLVQLAFFITPVIWERKQVSSEGQVYIDWNPFAVFLELLREPLLGRLPSSYHWLFGVTCAIVGWSLAFAIYVKMRPRIAYYV